MKRDKPLQVWTVYVASPAVVGLVFLLTMEPSVTSRGLSPTGSLLIGTMIGIFGSYFLVGYDMNRRLAITGGIIGMAATTTLWILAEMPSDWIIALQLEGSGDGLASLIKGAYPALLVVSFIVGAFMASSIVGLGLVVVFAIAFVVS